MILSFERTFHRDSHQELFSKELTLEISYTSLIYTILLQLKTSFLKNVQARNHKYTIFANFPEVQLYLRIVLGYLVIKIPYFSEFHDTTQTGSWLLSSQSLVYTILVYSDAGWISSSSWLDCHSDLDVFV